MQAKLADTKHTDNRATLRGVLRKIAGLFTRPNRPIKPRGHEVPDYLRHDIGLPPGGPIRHRTSDPPMRDPFRLL